MRTFLLNICALLVSGLLAVSASGQEISIDTLLRVKQQRIGTFDIKGLKPNQVALEMDFNSPVILYPSEALKYKGKSIEKIELVYTAYRLSEEFSQPRLNSKRLLNLQELSPDLFQKGRARWAFYAQTSGTTEEEARKLFHGFVITFRTEPSLRPETEYLQQIVNNDSLGRDSFTVVPKVVIRKRRVKTEYYVPKWAFLHKKGKLYTRPGIWNRRRLTVSRNDTITRYESFNIFNISENAWKYLAKLDTTVFTIMKRNSSWTDILFVCDVTGSMSPYTAQVLVWNKMNFNSRRVKYFTFFNDGDNMRDDLKRIGQTGGIYHVEARTTRDIDSTARLAMMRGTGGDTPENYMEALLSASQKFPEASEIVVVADNYANIKDISLLSRMKKPVHVILCGTETGINPHYLRLAFKTKGSVHTLGQDITHLHELKDGDKVKIGFQTFQVMKGRFQLLQEDVPLSVHPKL
jgi:hypothetical protein